MTLEKLENCSQCDTLLDQHGYDVQRCKSCGWPAVELGEPNQIQGARFLQYDLRVKTTWNFVGQIEQTTTWPFGDFTKRILNAQEKQVREALIALGWTPPEPK